MKYDINYIQTHDIDWYCVINGVCVHVASAGGILPDEMMDRDELRQLQHKVGIAEYIFNENEIEYNEVFLNARFESSEERTNYIQSFADVARKGFVSLDRTNWLDPEDNTYHIVCRPFQGLQKENQMSLDVPKKYQVESDFLMRGVEVAGINLLEHLKK